MAMRRIGALALVVLLVACGDDDDTSTDAPPSTTPPTFDGEPSLPDPGGVPGVFDVDNALRQPDGTRLTVVGHLIALPDGSAELCGGPIQESAPPRCGEPSLPVDGLADPASVPGTTDMGGWVEGDVELVGVVDGGRLVVS